MDKLIKYSAPLSSNAKTLFIWPEGVFSGYNFNEILILKKNLIKILKIII